MGPGTYATFKCQEDGKMLVLVRDGQFCLDPSSSVVCARHGLETIEEAIKEGATFVARSLDDEDRTEYDAGYALGTTIEMTERQIVLVAHVGASEAGLSTPENSSEMFDEGWMMALAEKVAAWYESHEGMSDDDRV
jgi:hypothetical protein